MGSVPFGILRRAVGRVESHGCSRFSIHLRPPSHEEMGSKHVGQLITNDHAGGGVHRMTDGGRSDLLAALRQELLEREARLRSLVERLRESERPREPAASAAHRTRPVRPGDPVPLTERELQILRLVVKGRTSRQIGEELGIGAATVRNRLSRIFWKLGVATRTHAAVRAIELGLCRSDQT